MCVGYTPCKHIFDRNLEKFCEQNPEIETWIGGISKEKWSMAYDKDGRRFGHMTTNLSECINKVFRGCRNLPITAFVKSTYSRCREYFVERGRRVQNEIREGHVYCTKIRRILQKNQEESCSHIVRVYDIQHTRFEVEETFNPLTQRCGKKWTVILNEKYCQCGKFAAFHYPCSHVIAVCGFVSIDFYQFVDNVLKNEYLLQAYSGQWWPLGNEDAMAPREEPWKLVPNASTIRGKGRPKSIRIRNEVDWMEPSQRRLKCGICGNEGHNRRQCPTLSSTSSHNR